MNSKLSVRDASIIRHILNYCQEIDDAIAFFGDDEDLFLNSAVYRNAISMPIQQIGELAKHLSDSVLQANPRIPWKQVKGMRDWFAHQYMKMDASVIWTVAREDMPALRDMCLELIDTQSN